MIHISPLHDIKPHYDATDCHCNPVVTDINGSMVVIHRTFDKRTDNPTLLIPDSRWAVYANGEGSNHILEGSITERMN